VRLEHDSAIRSVMSLFPERRVNHPSASCTISP
jgi:hypothetical protein